MAEGWAYDDTVVHPPDPPARTSAPHVLNEPVESPPDEGAPARPATPGHTELAARVWPTARTVAGYDPRVAIELSNVAAHAWDGVERRSPHYRDIMEHTPPAHRWLREGAGLTSEAHETHHGLQYSVSRTRRDHRFFYFREGVGAFVPQPKTGLRPLHTLPDGTVVKTADDYTASPHIVAELPAKVIELTKTRFTTYLGSPDRRTYGVLLVFDEWNAYLADARVGLELHAAGYYGNTFVRTDLLAGPVDFLYYASAGVAALAKREPAYWAEHSRQLKAVYALFAEDTMELKRAARGIVRFQGFHDDALLAHFVSSSDNRAMREFLTDWLGAPFTRRVFGF